MSEMPQCFTKTTPTAQKDHVCVECSGRISKGEVYQRVSGIWDGVGATYKTCAECSALRQEVIDIVSDTDEFPAFGELGFHCGEFGGDLEKRFKAIAKKRTLRSTANEGE